MKRVDAQTAIAALPVQGRIAIGANAGEPQLLVEELARQAARFGTLEVAEMLSMRWSKALVQPSVFGHIRVNALFIGAAVRAAVQSGDADYTPVFLSEIPALFRPGGPLPLDAALVQVSPPDEHGYCSMGVCVDVMRSAVENARMVIAQINPQMPRTLGNSFLHSSKIHYAVEHDCPLVTLEGHDADAVQDQIGARVAELVEDGCTLQTGIGGIPDAVLSRLRDRKDLGVHTEMLSDGVMELIEAGVITGAHKPLWPGKAVTSFVLGSNKLYRFVDNNPMVEMQPSDVTNDPYLIARHPRLVAINSALAIDLTGQVNADSIGTKFYSGIGGQVDFLRGAARSEGGRPIVALPSTAKNGTVSRIVPTLAPGAGVVTSRGDVHHVVTEWGRVNLHGLTIRQRARALISIAHPAFREQLEAEAQRLEFF
ncbi:MAG TPA: acetyl-CoA hydrolase/transferase C-terminal domain-containing protein [Myxococcota bacterium]|nr:acetyl-CoA hydrolase/transferase C-terminal domain-containing protein [Myxococcota bacterium]